MSWGVGVTGELGGTESIERMQESHIPYLNNNVNSNTMHPRKKGSEKQTSYYEDEGRFMFNFFSF